MPCVACSSTSSAFLSASLKLVPLPTTASSRSLGTTIMVSAARLSSARPCSACFIRFLPSNKKGLVTMAMVSAPISRAISAMRGAAPVPVPPPIPAVMNTRSAPSSALRISSRFSSSACAPISGRAPAPSPRVSLLPIWMRTSALDSFKTCASVFTEMKSTPSRSSSIIRLTAFPPPPPTPTTFMRAFWVIVSSYSKTIGAGSSKRGGSGV